MTIFHTSAQINAAKVGDPCFIVNNSKFRNAAVIRKISSTKRFTVAYEGASAEHAPMVFREHDCGNSLVLKVTGDKSFYATKYLELDVAAVHAELAARGRQRDAACALDEVAGLDKVGRSWDKEAMVAHLAALEVLMAKAREAVAQL